MQRSVGEERAQVGVSGSDALADLGWGIGGTAQEHNRRFGRAEQTFLERGNVATGFHALQGGKHYGQRLFVPVFTLTQPAHGIIPGGIDHEMKAAKSFDSDDQAFANRARGGNQRVVLR